MRVAEYLRRSSPGEEGKNYSIENQREDIARWMQDSVHAVVKTYSDPGGKSYTLHRPVLQQLFADAQAGQFELVVVGKYDRFSRSQVQQSVALFQLREYGVQVISATQPVPEGAVGDMMRNSYAFAAELELENIRARTAAGKRARVHSGKLPPVACPKYGYQFADPTTKEKYLPDPNTAPIVMRIFSDYVGGKTMRAIANELTVEGILTPTAYQQTQGWRVGSHAADRWGQSSILKMLLDPSYKGKMVGMAYRNYTGPLVNSYTGEVRSIPRREKRAADDSERYEYGPDVCPALVSEEVWNIAHQRMKENRELASRNTKHPHTLLLRHPLAVCGYCGGGVGASWHSSNQIHRYRCIERGMGRKLTKCPAPKLASIPTAELDAACWAWFVDQLTHPERIREQYDRYLARVGSVQTHETGRKAGIEAAMAQALEQKQNYFAAVGNATTDAMRSQFVGLAEDAEARYISLADSLDELVDEETRRAEQTAVIKSFQDAAPQALKNLANASNDQKRIILYRFQVRAVLYGRQHDPAYRFKWIFDDLSSDPQVVI
jgi:DNA invertase Pin-like site-specific DNA recombinase